MIKRTLLTSLLLAISGASFSAETAEGRIYNGEDVNDKNLYPWVTRIGEIIEENGSEFISTFCGGTLIHKDWVMTAAHCVDDKGPDDDVIVFLDNLDAFGEDSGEQIFASEIYIHPNYIDVGNGDDIALLKLSTPSNQNPANIITNEEETFLNNLSSYSDVLTTLGWGETENSPFSEQLQVVDLNYLPNNDCSLFWSVDNTQVCAEGVQENQDTCRGDSGGPLFFKNNEDKNVIYGITSYGTANCGEFPAVYTKTVSFSSYIEQITGLVDTTLGIQNKNISSNLTQDVTLNYQITNKSVNNTANVKLLLETDFTDLSISGNNGETCSTPNSGVIECSLPSISPSNTFNGAIIISHTGNTEISERSIIIDTESVEGEYRIENEQTVLYSAVNSTDLVLTKESLNFTENEEAYNFTGAFNIFNESIITANNLVLKITTPNLVSITTFDKGTCTVSGNTYLCDFNDSLTEDGNIGFTITGTVDKKSDPKLKTLLTVTGTENNSGEKNTVEISNNEFFNINLDKAKSSSSGGGGSINLILLSLLSSLLLIKKRH